MFSLTGSSRPSWPSRWKGKDIFHLTFFGICTRLPWNHHNLLFKVSLNSFGKLHFFFIYLCLTSVHPPVHLSMHLSIHLFIYPHPSIPIHPSPSIHPHPSIPIHPSISSSIHPSPSIYPSIRSSHLSVHPSITIHPSPSIHPINRHWI